MIRHVLREDLEFGDDEEFYRRIEEFNRHCIEQIRKIIWTILSFRCSSCWSFIKCLTRFIINICLRHYIAIFILVLSVFIFVSGILALRGKTRLIVAIYCLSFFACSLLSLFAKRGIIGQTLKIRSKMIERQKLLEQLHFQNGQEADEVAVLGAKRKGAFGNVMQPKQESEADPATRKQKPSYLNSSKSYSTPSYSTESSAGPSSAPDPFSPQNYSYGNFSGSSHAPEFSEVFSTTHGSGDYYNYGEPNQRLSVAHISAEAVKTFGFPVHVYGADSYRVEVHSSDDDSSYEPDSSEVNKFETLVEVNRSNLHWP